jgi:hypothetical protein
VSALALCTLASVPVAAAEPCQTDPGVAAAPANILFAEEQAILIVIDGDPVYQPLQGTDLQRIANTKPFIVRDRAGLHYLKVPGGWMEAYSLHGVWSVAGVPPNGAELALRRTATASTIALLEQSAWETRGNGPRLDDATAPAVFISTTPAELIVTDGPPRYATVEGTSLEYIENTNAHVFKEPTDDELYVLVSGRWLRAWTTDGPWEFVPASALPSDIAAIPADSPIWHRPSRPGAGQPKR